jgi:hypothetical protein
LQIEFDDFGDLEIYGFGDLAICRPMDGSPLAATRSLLRARPCSVGAIRTPLIERR